MVENDERGIPHASDAPTETGRGERQREEELRALLAAVVQSSDDAIISKSLEGMIRSWNRGAERIFGYTAEETIGRPITILILQDRLEEEIDILDRLKRGERIDHYETVRVRKDGSTVDISLTVSPIRDSAGNLLGASKIARDITLTKRIEQVLQDENRMLTLLNRTGRLIGSQLELRSLVGAISEAAAELSGAKYCAFFYEAMDPNREERMLRVALGASAEAFSLRNLKRDNAVFEEVFGERCAILTDDITQDPRDELLEPHHRLLKTGLPVRSYLAVPVISRSGEVVGGLFFGHPDRAVFSERTQRIIEGMAAQATVGIDNARLYEDVKRASKRREEILEAERAARAEAERINLMKDEFLSTLSHELRTPLTSILGWSSVLRSRCPVGSELEEGLHVIERNARAQTKLIDDLLDMSRIVSGKIRLAVEEVDLADVVRAAVASVRVSAEAKHIGLQLVMDPCVGAIRGDPGRLQQCIWNLLSNAIKFTPEGGRVQVSLQRSGDHLEVMVADNGKGIRPDFLPHIFDRFRQGDGSTTRHQGGLGLGLSIVKQLVELHGGKVRARSDGEGAGAEFTLELPAMPVKQATGRREIRGDAPPSAFADHPSLEGVAVLVIDDEPDAREFLKRVLEDCGARVTLAASASGAFERLATELPDVILSDIGMPDQDGYDFMRSLRKLTPEQGGQLPAAALTAFARSEDRTRALRAGFQTHVAKPVEPAELTAVIASLAIRR